MRHTLICTVGTSLMGNLSRLSPDDPIYQAWDAENLKAVALALLQKEPSERLCGAEINSIASICQEGILDRRLCLIFLVSDTPDGKKIGQLLEQYYRHNTNPFQFEQVESSRVLTGLNDQSVATFQQEGLKNLVREISLEVQKRSPESIAINATGGYKAQISFAGMIGQAFEIPVYYLFERFSKVIELPPQPVSLDLNLWLNHYGLFEELEQQQQLPKSEVADDLQDLPVGAMIDEVGLASPDGEDVPYVALSAMGQLFHNRCRLQFAKQETTLLSLVPQVETPPDQKPIKLRDDHGKDVLEDFAQKIRQYPYVTAIVNSLPFNPKALHPIRRAKPNGLIEFVLTWTDVGYGICIQTTGRTRAETNTVAIHLAKTYQA
ncbi:MAG: putative CRISPR-associated protein [Leptolyngbya sp. SIOISBB]|nr:putative CRISPR-associated protein [Leptolyngbya sp. SIOISBB]